MHCYIKHDNSPQSAVMPGARPIMLTLSSSSMLLLVLGRGRESYGGGGGYGQGLCVTSPWHSDTEASKAEILRYSSSPLNNVFIKITKDSVI